MVAEDIRHVYLNTDEFGVFRTVKYDGKTYENIPIVLNGLKEQDRKMAAVNHDQGLYLVTDIMHCDLRDIGGKLPEKGCIIEINTREGGTFFRRYYISQSQDTVGMVRMELEAIDE